VHLSLEANHVFVLLHGRAANWVDRSRRLGRACMASRNSAPNQPSGSRG
jgi:hypothetical protein